MINKYDEFIKEKEFNSIIESILLISESGKWTADNVYEWEEESTKDKLKKFLTKLPKEKIKEYFNIFLGKIPKNVKKRVLASYLFIFLSLVSYSELVDNNNKIDHKTKQTIGMMVDNNKHSVIKKEIKIEPVVVKKKTREDFLKDLAFKESSGNWKVINRFGYIGLYQFGRSALKDAGYKHIHKRDFKKDPNIFPVADQNKAMINLLKKNQHYMREKRGFEGYKHYIGQSINGIEMTESGILAAAHLIGNKFAKKFLKSGGEVDKEDANGTKCSDYMKKFANYELNI